MTTTTTSTSSGGGRSRKADTSSSGVESMSSGETSEPAQKKYVVEAENGGCQAVDRYQHRGIILYLEYGTRVSVSSSELATPAPSPASECVPPGTKGGGQHSLVGKGAGGANSDDWRESLALLSTPWVSTFLF